MTEADPLRAALQALATEWAEEVDYRRDRLDHAGEFFFHQAYTRVKSLLAKHPAPVTRTEYGVQTIHSSYSGVRQFKNLAAAKEMADQQYPGEKAVPVARQVADWQPVKEAT